MLKTDTARITSIVNIDNEKTVALNNMTACYDIVSKNLQLNFIFDQQYQNQWPYSSNRFLKNI